MPETATNRTYHIDATDVWQLVEYDLSDNGVDKKQINVPFNLAFTDDVTGGNTTVLADYIYFE
jgi:hypothetical protein